MEITFLDATSGSRNVVHSNQITFCNINRVNYLQFCICFKIQQPPPLPPPPPPPPTLFPPLRYSPVEKKKQHKMTYYTDSCVCVYFTVINGLFLCLLFVCPVRFFFLSFSSSSPLLYKYALVAFISEETSIEVIKNSLGKGSFLLQ